MKLTKILATNVINTQYSDLSDETIENTKEFILDTIGVGIAGVNEPGIPQLREFVQSNGGKGEASAIGLDIKVPARNAALLNGSTMHALDFDDTLDISPLHAYVSVLPAALAIAESIGGVSGEEFILAVTLGVDTVCRLGLALKTPVKFIRTSTCGYFGAAITASKLMGLSIEDTIVSCGIVLSRVAGSSQCQLDGGLVKRMHPGFAAESGVLSTILASKGVSGAKEPLESKYGYYNLYENGDFHKEAITNKLGEQYMGQQLSIKPYPSCRMTHSTIYGILELVSKNKISAEEVDGIKVRASKMVKEYVGRAYNFEDQANHQVAAQFSIPYTSAVALKKGSVDIYDFKFTQSSIDPEIENLAKKIEVVEDTTLLENDILTSNIKLQTKDGSIYSNKVTYPAGHPKNRMTPDEIKNKFMKCSEYGGMDPEKAQKLIEHISNLEELEDIDALCKIIRKFSI